MIIEFAFNFIIYSFVTFAVIFVGLIWIGLFGFILSSILKCFGSVDKEEK